MNWFTWIVIALGAVFLVYGVVMLARPRRSAVDDSARLREKYHGETLERGRPHDAGNFGGGKL
ncbi:hypothetical protein [Pimelobacter simplex]|uniref:hypothetical protein n=1 Tax=Nocardioides simplex TaxID=2045 RepID=UPI003AAEE2A1